MKPVVDLSGLDRLITHLRKVQTPQPALLQATTIRIMEEDNRRGILAGTDKDGGYMLGVTYRPEGKGKAANTRQKNNVKGRAKAGAFSGYGPAAAGLHNNLTSAEYRKLGGPPLAPRRQSSRVITNYRLEPFTEGPTRFGVRGFWFEVVDAKGRKFLHYHFDGKGQKRRDLRGIRPEGRARLRKAFIAWASDQIRYHGKGP